MITDSFGRAWRHGQCEVAIGCAGLTPLEDWRGQPDADGREMNATLIAIADEVAAAADLVRGKDSREPAVRLRGLERHVHRRRRPRRGAPGPRRWGRSVPLRSARRRGRGEPTLPQAARLARAARGVETVPRLLDLLAVRQRPRPERLQRRGHRGAQRRQRVLDPRRTSACTRRATRPSRSIARSVWVRTFSEIGDEVLEQLVVATRAVAEREQDVHR